MTCFEISINEELTCTAGVNDIGVLIASLELTRPRLSSEGKSDGDCLKLRVSGSENDKGRLERLDWLNRRVKVGDAITIRIIEASEFDEPKERELIEK